MSLAKTSVASGLYIQLTRPYILEILQYLLLSMSKIQTQSSSPGFILSQVSSQWVATSFIALEISCQPRHIPLSQFSYLIHHQGLLVLPYKCFLPSKPVPSIQLPLSIPNTPNLLVSSSKLGTFILDSFLLLFITPIKANFSSWYSYSIHPVFISFQSRQPKSNMMLLSWNLMTPFQLNSRH